MRIPTLLGLALLLIALGLGIFLFRIQQTSDQAISTILSPLNIQAVNLTDNSATIIWQTTEPDRGLVSYGTSSALGDEADDDRDNNNPTNHVVHYVTLHNLTPNTQYYFKVRSDVYFYPDQPLTFKTTPPESNPSPAAYNKPVFGVILDPSLQPVDEAIVLLNLAGASKVATITTTAGNFILPLVDLKTADYSSDFPITKRINADLIISRGTLSSDVKIRLPQGDNPLPNITLGKNSDFSNFESSPSAKLNSLDVNGDGVVNSLDEAIIVESMGTRTGNPKFNSAADLNHDGVIDQKDLNIIKSVVK